MNTIPKSAEAPWALYRAWCAAKGHTDVFTYDPARLDAFWADVPVAEKTRTIREWGILRALEAHGADVPRPERPPRGWREGPQWLDLEDALEAIPTKGWPEGMRGRRDAYLLVLLHQGFTREVAQQIGRDVIRWPAPGRIVIRGELIPTSPTPARCAACAVARWLRAVSLADYRSVGELKSVMNRQRGEIVHGHVCEQGDDTWRDTHWSLLHQINRWGQIDHRFTPISLTAISTIATTRRSRALVALPAERQNRVLAEVYTDLDPDAPLVKGAGDTESARAEIDALEERADEVSDRWDRQLENILAELGDVLS
ncbi:hypothetical protein [Microbacterium sp.]|uniref:hypothetical protein n=1 Tax=Microbacterium sp. TaxID=51671 RepID=UPI0026392464|nr:hypothetical protein [Microbacterium sp.]